MFSPTSLSIVPLNNESINERGVVPVNGLCAPIDVRFRGMNKTLVLEDRSCRQSNILYCC